MSTTLFTLGVILPFFCFRRLWLAQSSHHRRPLHLHRLGPPACPCPLTYNKQGESLVCSVYSPLKYKRKFFILIFVLINLRIPYLLNWLVGGLLFCLSFDPFPCTFRDEGQTWMRQDFSDNLDTRTRIASSGQAHPKWSSQPDRIRPQLQRELGWISKKLDFS